MIKIPFVKSIAKQSICSVITLPTISEQVLLFAGTLPPNGKIIVSLEDYRKIIVAKDSHGYYLIKGLDRHSFHVAGFELEIESINNFPRAEFGETRTNCNFKLK